MKQHLSDAIDDYRRARSTYCKPNTLRNDRRVLMALLIFAGNIWSDHITHDRMTEHLAKRAETLSPNSMRLEQQVLGGFFGWLEETRRCPRSRNPMRGRRKPKAERRERSRMSVSDFPHLLECAGKRHPRDRAFVALALYTMCRSSEIVRLRVGDLRLNDRRIMVVIPKTSDFDEVPVPPELDLEMRRWLMAYQEECGPLDKTWHLVPARRLVRFPGFGGNEGVTRLNPTRPLTHTASQIVKPALLASGFAIEGNPTLKFEGSHTLRRSSARALYDVLADRGHDSSARVVQTSLHHASMKTTEGYIGVSGDKKTRDDILLNGPMFPGLPGGLEIGAAGGGEGASGDAAVRRLRSP